MIEPIMYFGIGFLVAALLGLLFVPLVHNRAVRLTMRRLEAATPLSIAEIRADKDQLRAEFAMSTRRLEMSVEQMKTKTTDQLAELGKKTDAINQLKKELGEKTATIFALEARDKTLRDQLRATEEEFELKSSALREAERALVRQAGRPRQAGRRTRRALDHGRQSARRTRRVAHPDRSDEGQRRRLRARGQGDRGAAGARAQRGRSGDGNLERGARQARRARRPHRRARAATCWSQTTEAEVLDHRVQELEARLGDQGRLLAERDFEIDRLRSDIEAARKVESDLRGELENAGSRSERRRRQAPRRYRPARGAARAPRSTSATKLQREIVNMKREAETTWATERVENALLRERINDVAAEVARLTAVLEGPGSPIESMLAEAVPDPRRRPSEPHRRNGGETGAGRERSPQTRQGHARRPHPRAAIDRLARGRPN